MLPFLLSRYDRKSLAALAALLAVCAAIGLLWNDLLRINLRTVNTFLVAIWVVMGALLCWDVRPAQDVALALVGLAGGTLFEWWGTQTHLWAYFTGEQPPLWILPAWSVAALATARIAFALENLFSRSSINWWVPYWLLVAVFVAGMARFLWPAVAMPSSWVLAGLMGLVMITCRAPRRDVALMVGGCALGYFLEYWGTSRGCWTYYTHQVPPPVTVMAHGFSQVVFARTLTALDMVRGRVGLPGSIRAREAVNP